MDKKIRIGISSCLLGENVRYDGGHKHERYITSTLGRFFDWVPTCPEVAIGLGVPRPTIRFEMVDKEPRLVEPKGGTDLTNKMTRFSKKRANELRGHDIYGYIFKAKSPSCGMARLKIYRGYGQRPATSGVGVFADQIMQTMPNLPVEEEGRLMDPGLRENWLKRVFAYYNFKQTMGSRVSIKKLVEFHSAYKFVVLAHCPATYKTMGQIVANAKQMGVAKAGEEYETLMMMALKKKATRAKHVNVQEHLLGFFKKELSPEVRREILQTIQDYRREYVSIVVPITLIKHYAKILGIDYLKNQAYLNPHPKELALLSAI